MDERMAAAASSSSPYRHIDPNDPYGFLFLEIGFVSDDQMELLTRAPILNEVVRQAPPPPPDTVPPLTPISHEQPLPSIVAAPVPATSTPSSVQAAAAAASNPRPRPVVCLRDLLPPLPEGLSIAETVDVLWRERYPERDPETEPKSVVHVAELKGFWWHGDKGAGSSSGAS